MTTSDQSRTELHPSTALVCLTVPTHDASHARSGVWHDPSFVTQLIATAADLPHTRVRRRGSTADALTAYLSADRWRPVCTGLTQRIA